MNEEPFPGRYRHFKGGVYEVLFVARDSEAPKRRFVVYKSAEGEIWARPLEMFLEHVERASYSGPRFVRAEE